MHTSTKGLYMQRLHVHTKKATLNFIRSPFIFAHHSQMSTGRKSADFLSFFSPCTY